MFTLSSDILSLTDEAAVLLQNRRVVYANAAAKAILGGDCIGKGVRELFGDEVAEAQAPSFIAAVPVSGKQQLLRVSRADGLQLVFFSRRDDNAALFNDAYLQALRSALMNINLAAGAGRSIAEELAHPELKQCFSRLSREYFMMNRLLSNIAAARGILNGDLPCSLSAVDLGALVSDLCDSVSLLRPDVELRLEADRRILLWADPQLLELMLLNLLSNCLVHASGLTRIQLELKSFRDRVYLTVRDDGCGVSAEKMSSLFHRYRTAISLQEMSLGAGLGLTVIRGVAEAHGGALMLESRENAGTMVRISLSRDLGLESKLAEKLEPYAGSMDRLLTGLSPCLPLSCFEGQYFD